MTKGTLDPSAGSGYVWHCHILDHEDNDMMRPYQIKSEEYLNFILENMLH